MNKKGFLDFSEIKTKGVNQLKDLSNSIGSNIYYNKNGTRYKFTIISKEQKNNYFMVEFQGKQYKMYNRCERAFEKIISGERQEYNKNAPYKNTKKRIGVFKDGIMLGEFESTKELERVSEKMFGVKLVRSMFSSVANGKYKQYKGFTFEFIKSK